STVTSPDKAVEALQKLYDSGHHFIIVDGSAETLLKLSDFAKGKDILLFNVRAEDVSLRQENCRVNIMHVVPDRYMLADALAQYLVVQKWTNWLLVHGSPPGALAYADAIRRAAGRFGATMVDDREYKDISGGRRDDVGTIPPGKQASIDAAFAANPDYQVIIVADEDQLFGPYMPYRGGADPRPVARTTGLTATTWSPGHEKWGATQANNHFQKDYKRLMLPIDYQAYVAARTIGEAVTRNGGSDFATIAAFIHGPELQLAPFKGIKQQYRPWDGQFRQPILMATDKVPVSMSPQRGFPHASHPEIEMDTLGIDQPESQCKMYRSSALGRGDRIAVLVQHRDVISLKDRVDAGLVLGQHLVDRVLPLRLARTHAHPDARARRRHTTCLGERHELERHGGLLRVIASDRAPQDPDVELP